MTVKALQTASRLCTILDVVNKFPKIVTDSINLDETDSPIVRYGYQIDQSITDVSEEIISSLLPIYRSTSNLAATAPWVGIIISNKQNNDPTARLRICQAGASAITEMFTITFSSASAYAVTGYLSGGVGSGSITTDFTGSGDGDIIIAALTNSGTFTGTFASGDKIFVSINKWHRTIATIATYLATADALRSIFFETGINDETALIEKLSNHAKRIIKQLQMPDDKNGYALSTLPSRDFSDLQMGDWSEIFDSYGNANTTKFQTDDLDNYST